jgi:hypothetical protein
MHLVHQKKSLKNVDTTRIYKKFKNQREKRTKGKMHLELLISSHILGEINRQTSMNYILLSKKI